MNVRNREIGEKELKIWSGRRRRERQREGIEAQREKCVSG